jgi:hypothetical protein
MFFAPSFKLILCVLVVGFAETSGAVTAVTDQKCSPGQHWVRSHSRGAYTRSDGTLVSATHVQAHCQRPYW